MTNKEYEKIKQLLSDTCKTYKIVSDGIAKKVINKNYDKYDKLKMYYEDLVQQHVIWRNKLQCILNDTKQGKADWENFKIKMAEAVPEDTYNKDDIIEDQEEKNILEEI